MNYEFNHAVNTQSISTSSIRFKAIEQLAEIKEQMKAEVAALKDFNETSGLEEVEEKESDFFDAFIFNLVSIGPVSAMIAAHFAVFGAISASVLGTAVGAFTAAVDNRDAAKKAELFWYPEGRRSFKIGDDASEVEEDFNLVSSGSKERLSKFHNENKKQMYEILGMLKKLEDEGVDFVEVKEDGNAYDALKTAKKMSSMIGSFGRQDVEVYNYAVA